MHRTKHTYPLTLGLVIAIAAVLLPVPAPASEPAAPPMLRLVSPRGGQTRERIVTIQGETRGVTAKRLTLVLNGVDLTIPRNGDAFSTQQVLSPGLNTIRVETEQDGIRVADQVDVFARVPPKDLRVTLAWDTPGTDVDLWVTGPDGEKIYYQHKQGAAGGTLDTDVTTGYGPETYTQARSTEGAYLVQAHYYAGAMPSRVTLNVIRGEGTPNETREIFRAVLLRKDDIVTVGEFTVGP